MMRDKSRDKKKKSKKKKDKEKRDKSSKRRENLDDRTPMSFLTHHTPSD